ncbi:MAG: nitroreductase [Candidatus Sericytochromatia bacterium]|nr:nitroreductase [Candidatus Sericytochromatia bacterium]
MSEQIQALNDVQHALHDRRTVFQFQDRPVDAEIIMRALASAHWAPNHKHSWPWRFVLPGPGLKARLVDYFAARLEKKLRNRGTPEADLPEMLANGRQRQERIPAQIIVYATQCGDPLRDKEDFASACCATQNLMLALWSEGVASGWKTFDSPEAYALLGLDPASANLVGLIQLGYPQLRKSGRRPPLQDFIIQTD